jgi:hypothetical protein
MGLESKHWLGWNLIEMQVLFFDIWMTVSDYNTINPTVIILVWIGIFTY